MIRPAQSDLGAFLRACQLLGEPAGQASQATAHYFRLEFTPRTTPLPEPVVAPPPRQAVGVVSPPKKTPPSLSAPSGNRIPIEVTPLPVAAASRPSWLAAAIPLPVERKRARVHVVKPSLLNPAWTRGILTAALATMTESNEVDIDRVIRARMAGEPMREVPYLPVRTFARGVYCWVDQGPAMEPFYADQGQLVAALMQVAGEARTYVTYTDGVPPLDAFLPGAPHLILSDLGITRVRGRLPRATPRAWAEFAAQLTGRFAAPVVALAPRAVKDYPLAVRQALHLLPWDRPTSVQTVRASHG